MLLTEPDFQFLSGLVAQCSGNVILPRQAYMLEQQLTPIAKSVGHPDLTGLVSSLRRNADPVLANRIAEAVTINESSFFRDSHPFEALRKVVIPELIKRNQATKRIRIWCAACSRGQEPYSIAITLREHFPQLADWKVEVVATDISDAMLDQCRCGSYSQLEVNRGMPTRSLVRFFDRDGANWKAKQELKDLIEFKKMNLTGLWPPLGMFDVVFIRNVLIYFKQDMKSEILKRVRQVLPSDGYLFIGSAETTIGQSIPFLREEIDASVCYRPEPK